MKKQQILNFDQFMNEAKQIQISESFKPSDEAFDEFENKQDKIDACSKANKMEADILKAVKSALGVSVPKFKETEDVAYNHYFEYNGDKLAIGLGGSGSFENDFSGNVCLGIFVEGNGYSGPEEWVVLPINKIETELMKYKKDPSKYRKAATYNDPENSGSFFN